MTKAKTKSIEKIDEEVMGDEKDADYDDEAPDAVSFNQGKEEALESISNALRDLQRTKLKAKERRRERDKLLKEQKQKKKVSLSKARLPPDLLSKLSQQEDTTLEPSEKLQHSEQPVTQTGSSEKVTDYLREEDDEDEEEDEDEDEDEDWEDEKHPSSINVIQSSKTVHPPPHEAALQFLQNQMYGSRIPRESMVKNVSRKLKRYGKPGMNFCQNKSRGVKKNKKKRSSWTSAVN